MKRIIAGAVLVCMALLSGCGTKTTTCYGVEPDGDVEKLQPCPHGWKDKETRIIGEDQFKHLEVNDPKSNKNNKGTGTVKVKPTR